MNFLWRQVSTLAAKTSREWNCHTFLHPSTCKPLLEGPIFIIALPGIRITWMTYLWMFLREFPERLSGEEKADWVWVVAPRIAWVDSGAELKGKKENNKRRGWDPASTSPTCPSVNAVCTTPYTPAMIDQIPPQTTSQNEPFLALIDFFRDFVKATREVTKTPDISIAHKSASIC